MSPSSENRRELKCVRQSTYKYCWKARVMMHNQPQHQTKYLYIYRKQPLSQISSLPPAVSFKMARSLLALYVIASGFLASEAFAPRSFGGVSVQKTPAASQLCMSDFAGDFIQEPSDSVQTRIQDLVNEKPVLLFMKGSKLFPQCGFSNTACQILNSFGIEYHTVDVLADEGIRSGVKEFSQWPTIPQLYVAGEFVGGSDIMIEMYQNGELAEMIEKAKADMM